MKHIFTTVFSTLFLSVCSAQSNSIFGYVDNDNLYSAGITVLTEGDDNHFYAVANDYSAGFSTLVKSNQNGQIVWQKRLLLGESGNLAQAVQVRFHNNYIYVLAIPQYTTAAFSYPLAKIDVNGNLIWAKSLTTIDNYPYQNPSIDFGPSGEIIVASSTFSRVELFSLNEDGSTNWVRNCSSDSTEYKNPNFDIATCDNGDIMGACKSGSDMCFYRMNSDGSPEWSRRILEMDQAYTHIKSIRKISTNVFIACGYRMPDFMTFESKGFYTLLDGSGNFISFTMVNGISEIKNIYPLDNGNLLLIGNTSNDYQCGLIEINTAGTVINSYKTSTSPFSPVSYESVADINGTLFIGDSYYVQKLSSIAPTDCFDYASTTFTYTGEDPGSAPSAGYFVLHPVTGTVSNNTSAHLEPGTLQVAQGCALITGIEEPNSSNVKVYPTLLTNNQLMSIQHELTGEVQYQIMDINGKMIEQDVLTNSSVMIHGLSTGMYVLQLINNGSIVHHNMFVVN